MEKLNWKEYIGVFLFYLFIGVWLIPTVLITPVVVLNSILKMAVSGQAPLLDLNLTVLVPMALGLWYLFQSSVLRKGVLNRMPVLGPALLMGFAMTVITKLTEHALYLGLVRTPELRGRVTVQALLLLVLGRVVMSIIFKRWPARRMVPY